MYFALSPVPTPLACPGRAGAGQIEDTCALRLELSGAAPALFLGQQVQPRTDTKIHSQGEGRQAKRAGLCPPPRTWLPPEDTFSVRTPRVLILSPRRCKCGQHFSRGLDSGRGIPPALAGWPRAAVNHAAEALLGRHAAGDSMGAVNQELTPFHLSLPCDSAGLLAAWEGPMVVDKFSQAGHRWRLSLCQLIT